MICCICTSAGNRGRNMIDSRFPTILPNMEENASFYRRIKKKWQIGQLITKFVPHITDRLTLELSNSCQIGHYNVWFCPIKLLMELAFQVIATINKVWGTRKLQVLTWLWSRFLAHFSLPSTCWTENQAICLMVDFFSSEKRTKLGTLYPFGNQ